MPGKRFSSREITALAKMIVVCSWMFEIETIPALSYEFSPIYSTIIDPVILGCALQW
jgi:hypothetical protein